MFNFVLIAFYVMRVVRYLILVVNIENMIYSCSLIFRILMHDELKKWEKVTQRLPF
jgi:hypothetical protein